ncbi:hypothetical protein A2446_04540 [Candidatus Roizmanbacteria bacterium RIFOXYC2_FULL_38_9]|uniref:Dockerin domain-containing protein n=1 Tax=Candidatus Roizmanbacteria bacterium RIFOXYD1_FULL_38_12 TaxID=1802093 RepID=A0A1F7L1A4_9BACT|nr:MAG: hypothetical protein A3K47_04035 [Candidatus Roizmanbacteria bacterium RIFOXYA2_FULL_38_14]OGK63927.1 MAG: hypothetical protein A3K27_04035 [Candidatus Roizmanbacteria bacterium RIFOXYA1_FULL_37_12]OGK65773.1 MAG: hypothetical protein A3K38_04035 [Candidatus Roizmanbacteria bacterium RIFOXYB1_FULL_40_23]OGK70178.1 MAG: hypothetical protein A3K21_04040 [Candidatus Roizmanbacteria bacterium RIFOXYC1_FULL_38_14]OGK71554.1 MAG: hypothetical protein A2446_04540 [Candidatus Roizmanbacteria ba
MKKLILCIISLIVFALLPVYKEHNVFAADPVPCGANECEDPWRVGLDGVTCVQGNGCPSAVCTNGSKGSCKMEGGVCVPIDGGSCPDVSGDKCYLCIGDEDDDDDGGGGGGTKPSSTPIPTPTCNQYQFKTGGIEPYVVMPGADVLVKCGYGADLDCLSVSGGGLTNCTQRTYVNGETIFACRAGYNPGTYTDAACVVSSGTKMACCAGTDYTKVLSPYSVLSTAAHFIQKMRVPSGSYTLSVRAYTVISKGNGAFVDLLCANPDCGGGKKENDSLGIIPLPQNPDFETKSIPIVIPADGNNKDYRVRVVAGEGSELYVDWVSFAGGGKEYVLNGEFKNIQTAVTSISLDQPNAWGDASNKLGYYYGMAINTKVPPGPPPGGGGGGGGSSSSIPGATAVKLVMKIKLQGVTAKPRTSDSIDVKVKLGGRLLSSSTAYQTAKFTVGADGVWSGTADFSVPPGDGYVVYVKGPKHLQKKICDAAASEAAGGTYHCGDGKITIKAGDNSVDFSKILLLVGDLPENGAQNGIIDAYDTGYIRTHLQSTNSSELQIGDLNYDGVIDSQDFSLVLASLSIKYDEE